VDTQETQKPQTPAPKSEDQSSDFRPQKNQAVTTQQPAGLAPKQIEFSNKNKANLVVSTGQTAATDLKNALGLSQPGPVLLLLGGDGELEDDLRPRVIQFFSRGIARAALDIGALIIDSGQHAGITAMMGQGVADRGHQTPLIGVAPASKVTYPNGVDKTDAADTDPLDDNHSHFVLTGGHNWGDEVETMFDLAKTLAQNKPVVTLLVNGGKLAKKQVLHSVRHNWPVVVIKGSGNLADELATLWQERPDFIPDPDLAEIIFDGRRHFFQLERSIAAIERLLEQLTSHKEADETSTLELAWRTFAMYDAGANRQQAVFNRFQKWILSLGVIGTLLALAQTQLEITGIEAGLVAANILYYLILLIPISVSLLVAASNRFNAGNKWILSRASAESIKKEIYRYRARAEIYSDLETRRLSRDIKLTRKIDITSSKLMQTDVNTAAMPPYTGPIPPKYGAAEGDDGMSYLTPDRYLKYRLQDQLAYYRGKTVQLEKQLKQFQWLIYLAGAAGTLLAAIGLELWIALTTALVTAFTTYLEYQKTEEKLMRYNQTATDLANVERWWMALSAEEQADPANIDKLVGQTEATLYSEHAAWVQDMQDAMAELRAEQTNEEKASGEHDQTKQILATKR